MFGRALANTVLLPPIITARRAFRECRFLRIIIPNNFFFFFPRGRTPIQRHLIRFGKNVLFSNVGIIYYKNKHFATTSISHCVRWVNQMQLLLRQNRVVATNFFQSHVLVVPDT